MPIATVASLPDEALEEPATIFRDTRGQGALPIQQLLVLLATIPKKLGGVRCVALSPAISRIVARIKNPEFKWWDMSVALDGATRDTAALGANAREIAVERPLKDELARIRGKDFCSNALGRKGL